MDEVKKAEFAEIENSKNEKENKEINLKTDLKNITKLMDITLNATVELGSTKISIEKALNIDVGSVIELNKIAGEPVDFYINDYLFARGEVVVIDDKYGIRITELINNSLKEDFNL